jgi:hypothetical protein
MRFNSTSESRVLVATRRELVAPREHGALQDTACAAVPEGIANDHQTAGTLHIYRLP